MGRKAGMIGAAIVVVLLAVGAFMFVHAKKDSNSTAATVDKVTSQPTSGESMSGMAPTTDAPAPPSPGSSDTSGASNSANTVTIKDFNFGPQSVTVQVGTTVTWTNQDSASHTVTADQASADAPASQNLAKGQSYNFTFKKAGTYAYHCQIHPNMKGTVVVTE